MKKGYSIFCVLAVNLLIGIFLYGREENICNEGSCPPELSEKASTEIRVFSPVGEQVIRNIVQAPRLKTLAGKRIAITGGSFMAYITHAELKRLILEKYPSAKIFLLKEIGSAGPWPAPGVRRKEKDEFMRRLKDWKIDAVISGNGGCGLCTPKEMGSCIAAEYLSIPSVMITAPNFVVQAKKTAKAAGIPAARIAVYPGAFSLHNKELLLKNTRETLFPQIEKALTSPFTAGELQEGKKQNKTSFVLQGSAEELHRYFIQKNFTDGLPIVLPAEEKVKEFLRFSDLPADSVIAKIPPAYREATVRLIAVNGVMAGCEPEFMPVLIAIARAMADGDFRRTLASTHAWTPYCWINGPLSRQLKLDHGQGMISEARNRKIGRFIELAMKNLGGYYIKENRMGTFGYLMPWCLAEDEKTSIALSWRPYHMLQGYALNENVLTASSALSWGNNMTPATSDGKMILELLAWDAVEKQQFALGSGTPFVFRTLLLTPGVAKRLAEEYPSKAELENALIRSARQPLQERVYANYWANPGSSFNNNTYSVRRHSYRIRNREKGALTATPPWLDWCGKNELETVPVMLKGKSAILVCGDPDRNKTMWLPGGGYASIKIDLPANWDLLMKEKGYAPLKSFYLVSPLKPLQRPQQYKFYRTGMGNKAPFSSERGRHRR